MSYLSPRRTIGCKKESTPYTIETIAATDFNLSAYNINYSPEIAMKARKIARGDFGAEPSVAGKQTITISFTVDIQEGATAATPPTYFKCLESCGFLQTIYGAVGVGLLLSSDYSKVPMTFEIVEKDEGASPTQIVITAVGCVGNARVVVDAIGEPCKIEFEFKGVLYAMEHRLFASILTPTGFMASTPDAVMGVSLMAFGQAQTLNKVTIDLTNDVQIYTDPANAKGVSGAHIVNREAPKVDIDPDLISPLTHDFYTRWKDSTIGALSFSVGNNLVISSAHLQVVKAYAPGEREGHVVNNVSFIITRDDLEILQGAKA